MFPIMMTIHNPAQLNAVMAALSLAAEPTTQDLTQIAKDRTPKAEEQPVWPHPTKATPETAAAPAPKPQRTSAKPEAASSAPSSPIAEAAAAAAPAQSTAQPAPQRATAAPAAASSAAEPVTYDQVARAISAAVRVSREHVVATLKQFGAAKGPELKPAQYAEFLAELTQAEAVPA